MIELLWRPSVHINGRRPGEDTTASQSLRPPSWRQPHSICFTILLFFHLFQGSRVSVLGCAPVQAILSLLVLSLGMVLVDVGEDRPRENAPFRVGIRQSAARLSSSPFNGPFNRWYRFLVPIEGGCARKLARPDSAIAMRHDAACGRVSTFVLLPPCSIHTGRTTSRGMRRGLMH